MVAIETNGLLIFINESPWDRLDGLAVIRSNNRVCCRSFIRIQSIRTYGGRNQPVGVIAGKVGSGRTKGGGIPAVSGLSRVLDRQLSRAILGLCLSCVLLAGAASSIPNLINFQGRLIVRGESFQGDGEFKFALLNGDGSVHYWRNGPDSNSDGEPDSAVLLPVNRGLYSVALGDKSLGNMAALPPSVFTNGAVFLRIWFNDGTAGFQRLAPDQRITAVGYAMMAANIADEAVTREKLAPDLNALIGSLPVVSSDAQDAALALIGYRVFMSVPAAPWVNGPAAAVPSARWGHSAVWTGLELLVWGGNISSATMTSSGGAYQLSSDLWRVLSTFNAPSARSGHTAVWTGSEMILWGGVTAGGYAVGGGRFNPDTQNWTTLPAAGAPASRQGHVAAWTGSRMLLWGGLNNSGLLSDGALFDPILNQWTALIAGNSLTARYLAAAVWTGDRLIVWGGQGPSAALNTGSQLLFNSNTPQADWQTVSGAGAPSARFGHTAVWTGQHMIIWGGTSGSIPLNDGAAYDPANGTWSALPALDSPSARSSHNAVWTGAEMIITGGENAAGALSSSAAYDPAAKKWRSITNPGSPIARSGATAAWSGTEVLMFGGKSAGQPVAALQKLNPQPPWYFYRKP